MFRTDEGWRYKYGFTNAKVIFNWRFGFGWQSLSPEKVAHMKLTDPVNNSAVIGTFASMDKTFFEEIGAFDEGMIFWGGENIDLPLRTWLFGGQAISVPCSRIAHLEADHAREYRRNYTELIARNYKRVVEVWFDDYKKYYYLYNPTALEMDVGDLTSRFEVKKRALHNFDWFLKNVSPELGIFDVDSFAWGTLKNVGSPYCVDMNVELTVYYCSNASLFHQMFFWSTKFELRMDIKILMSSPENTVTNSRIPKFKGYIAFYGNDRGTKWIHWKGGPIVDYESKLCLEAGITDGFKVILSPCHYGPSQLWTFSNYSSTHYNELLLHESSRYPNISQFLKTTMERFRNVQQARNL
jgi:polypeptide N-acetylgalactosaminyltransferase